MSKRFYRPFNTLVLLTLTIIIVLFASSVSFSAETYTIPQTAEVTIAWDANDPAPDGYCIYQRAEGQSYDYSQPCWTGPGTSGTVYNLDWDTTYYFVVRAYAETQESADSEEVSFFAESPAPTTYTISVSAGDHGSISPGGAVTVNQGSDQVFMIAPDTGYHIADVKVDGISKGAISTYTFSQVAAHHTIDASFTIDAFTISAVAGANGDISPAGSTRVDWGADQTFIITPDDGCLVANVIVDGVAKGAISSYTFEAVTGSHTITADFTVSTTYKITASAGVNGSISPSGTVIADQGGRISYTITPAPGHFVADVLVDGMSTGAVNTYTFDRIEADHTIHATFAPDTFVITATADINGSITPTGVSEVPFGSNQIYTFTAEAGFHISDVLVDGQSVGAPESYTFFGVTKGHTIAVNFSDNTSVNIWVEAEDGDLQLPMEIADDETAGAGGYIWAPSGSGNLYSPSDSAGYAEYNFEVPESGDYVIWGRQISNDGASDSFFVSVDGQAEMAWHTKPGGQDVWTWDVVSLRTPDDLRDPDAPERYRLAAGPHTLKIKQREDGTKLDRILITNQVDLTDPEPDSVIDAMEFGDVQVNHNWTRVNFSKPFVNPVVVAGPSSFNGRAPVVVRIQHVDATGFEVRLQEWDYLDGSHTTETVSYLAMEQGTYTLKDGTKIEAANVNTGAAGFRQVLFSETFNVCPVLMTSVASFNDPIPVIGRMKNITISGFEYRMQEQEENVQDHGTESYSYIAWEPSSGEVGGTTYLVEKTADDVTHKINTKMFETPFSYAPVFLADMQTTNGGNTANVRCKNKGELSVDLWIDEEQSRDTEVSHISEVVGYMAFSH
jgi:List-Bact-rpt repeat protein